MSDYDDNDDYDIPELRKAHRSAQKRVKELESEITELRKQGRERAVKDVLSAKGVNNPGKVAKLIPADLSDEAAVEGWLNDYADVLGITSSEPAADGGSEATEGAPVQGAVGVSPADVAALADINQAGSGTPIEAQTDTWSRIQNASDPEELAKILAGRG